MTGFMPKRILFVLALGLAVVVVGGCATAPAQPDPAVQNARNVYAAATAGPHVKEYAPVQLREAYQYLKRAEEAESKANREHLAYLAERHARLAMAVTEKRIAEDEMAQLAQERDALALQSQRQRARAAEVEAERQRRKTETAQRRLERQELETQRLRGELAEFKARETDRGLVLTLDSFLFETDSAALKPGAYRSLDKLAGFLRERPDRNIVIEGHTDNTGSAEYNIDLSRRRADAVAQVLRSQGIERDRMVTRGYGEGYPVASNENPAGRLQNRRVEIVIEEPQIRAGGRTGR